MKELLEAAGFTDVEENQDGTLNGVHDGRKYTGIRLTSMEPPKIEDSVITQDISMGYVQ